MITMMIMMSTVILMMMLVLLIMIVKCEDGDGDVDDTWGKVPPLQNPYLRCPCFSQVVQQKN